MKKILKIILPVLICLGAGWVGSLFTSPSIANWYADLHKPSFNPPNWVFAPVWTLLFILMGLSFYFVWQKSAGIMKIKKQVFWFIIQLILNIGWSFLFFGMHRPAFAFIEIIFLWLAILITIVEFKGISKLGAWLFLPYFLWVSFASALNFAIFLLN